MTTLMQRNEIRTAQDAGLAPLRVIVAREGTELADRLRATGWVARAGWRSTKTTGEPVWHLRFEVETSPVARS